MSEMSDQDFRKREAKLVSKMIRKSDGIFNDEEKTLKDRVDLDIQKFTTEFLHSESRMTIPRYQYIRNRLYATLSEYCRQRSNEICAYYIYKPELKHHFKFNSIDKDLHG